MGYVVKGTRVTVDTGQFTWQTCHTCHKPITTTSHFEQSAKNLRAYCERCYQKHIRHAGPINHPKELSSEQ